MKCVLILILYFRRANLSNLRQNVSFFLCMEENKRTKGSHNQAKIPGIFCFINNTLILENPAISFCSSRVYR